MRVSSIRWPLPVALCLLLPGCAGLLGGGKPDRLYSLSGSPAEIVSGLTAARSRTIELLPPRFAPEVAGDRILTSDGNASSYIKDARWTSAAPALFAARLAAGFAERTRDVALVGRRDIRGAGIATLRIEVTRFEAVYPAAGVAPTVLIQGEAALVDAARGEVLGTYRFAEKQVAGADRVGAIVAAFDAVVARVTAGTVDWTAATLPSPRPAR